MFHRSRTPLVKWLLAIYLVTSAKNDIATLELARQLGVKWDTAWLMKQKLMEVMLQRNATYKLVGEVQIDDACLGGEEAGKVERGAANKVPFVIAFKTRNRRLNHRTIRGSSCGMTLTDLCLRKQSSYLGLNGRPNNAGILLPSRYTLLNLIPSLGGRLSPAGSGRVLSRGQRRPRDRAAFGVSSHAGDARCRKKQRSQNRTMPMLATASLNRNMVLGRSMPSPAGDRQRGGQH